MNKILNILAGGLVLFSLQARAQDSSRLPMPSQLLQQYYQLKNALVTSNAAAAATAATAFARVANVIDYKIISEGNINILLKDAGKISEAGDLNRQRQYFANLSVNMSAVAKAVKLSDQPVYEVYCPMKKAYWLSSEKAIRNPYYGNSMLTCGQVTETIQ